MECHEKLPARLIAFGARNMVERSRADHQGRIAAGHGDRSEPASAAEQSGASVLPLNSSSPRA
jgi:hypothetical protein